MSEPKEWKEYYTKINTVYTEYYNNLTIDFAKRLADAYNRGYDDAILEQSKMRRSYSE